MGGRGHFLENRFLWVAMKRRERIGKDETVLFGLYNKKHSPGGWNKKKCGGVLVLCGLQKGKAHCTARERSAGGKKTAGAESNL